MSWLSPWVAAAPGGEGGAAAALSGELPTCEQTEHTNVIPRDYRGCLFNARGMKGNLVDEIYHKEFIEIKEGFLSHIGFL